MKIVRKILLFLILLVIAFSGFFTYKGYSMYKVAVDECPIETKVEEIQKIDNYTEYSKLPDTYVKAVVSAEDKRFWTHGGFDIIATARAMWHNIENNELIEGGSTITQQLGRIMYFTQEKDISRKIAEVFVARSLEKKYDKDEILELYVNCIYFGSGYYSIYDASMGYFNKKPCEMNFYESTMLAGIPNAPSIYSLDVNPKLAEERRQQVISCMKEDGYEVEEEP